MRNRKAEDIPFALPPLFWHPPASAASFDLPTKQNKCVRGREWRTRRERGGHVHDA